jgi:hypothetical protein
MKRNQDSPGHKSIAVRLFYAVIVLVLLFNCLSCLLPLWYFGGLPEEFRVEPGETNSAPPIDPEQPLFEVPDNVKRRHDR